MLDPPEELYARRLVARVALELQTELVGDRFRLQRAGEDDAVLVGIVKLRQNPKKVAPSFGLITLERLYRFDRCAHRLWQHCDPP